MKTRSLGQYEEKENCIVSNEIGETKNYASDIVVFGDMLDFNEKPIDPFFTRGCH